VLDADSYSDFEPLVCFGDGASKMKAHWSHRNVVFYDENTVTARGQVELAYAKFQRNEVQDVAYFEPNYIKAFYQAPSTKKQV
jgi:tRNA threonylcarbamoyladenosine biosynthesis protein TsaB